MRTDKELREVVQAEIIARRSGKFIYQEVMEKLNIKYKRAREIRLKLEKQKVIDSKLNIVQINIMQ